MTGLTNASLNGRGPGKFYRLAASLTFLIIFLVSCIEYHPYEASPDETNLTKINLDRLLANPDSDTLRFALIGDTQRFYDETDDFVDVINGYPELDMVIVSGDLSDFGIEYEFELMHDLFAELSMPYLTVIGNHDLVYNGKTVYEEMYGALDYSFTFKGNKFIMINTNSREFGFNGRVPNISWLRKELSEMKDEEQAIIVSHVPPDAPDFDPDLVEPYLHTLDSSKKVLVTLNGHLHGFREGKFPDSQVRYINSYSTEKRSFVIVKIWDRGYDYQQIPY
ncbi:metallophosphoesterase [bacterium SCSIO 12741]|nr:metallophosphoesterase [bacterium SCSIO 12741]